MKSYVVSLLLLGLIGLSLGYTVDETLGFESKDAWQSQALFELLDLHGNKVLKFAFPEGFNHGANFSTTSYMQGLINYSRVSYDISVDVRRINSTYLGAQQYYGNIQFYLTSKSKNLAHEYIGQVELSNLGVWDNFKNYSFTLAKEYINVLAEANDVKISFTISVNRDWQNDEALLLDNIAIKATNKSIIQVTDTIGLTTWEAKSYNAGDKIIYTEVDGTVGVYEAKEWPYTPWCQQAVYAPGSTLWEHAWTKVGVVSATSGKGAMPLFDQWWDLGEFAMFQSEVTQGEFYDLLKTNPSNYKPGFAKSGNEWRTHPVENVSWYEAVYFANALSKKEFRDTVYSYTKKSGVVGVDLVLEGVRINPTAEGYRLPTCEQWRKASFPWKSQWKMDAYRQRSTPWYKDSLAENHAWFEKSSHSPIMTKKILANNLYDICGNVSEILDPETQNIASAYAAGGGYQDSQSSMTVHTRKSISLHERSIDRGFRLILVRNPWRSLPVIWRDNAGETISWRFDENWTYKVKPEAGITFDEELQSNVLFIKTASNDDDSRVHSMWKADLSGLEPNRSYVVSALVKGSNLVANEIILNTPDGKSPNSSEFKGATVGGNNKISREGLSSVGTFGWKKVSGIFSTNDEGNVTLQLSLGGRNSTATGEVYFDSVVVRGPLTRVRYNNQIADLEPRQVRRISESRTIEWLQKLEEIQLTMEEITGKSKLGTDQLTGVVPSSEFIGGLVSGFPFSFGTDHYLWFLENTINPHLDVTWGALHEIGHNNTWKGFNIASELMANFLGFLALEDMENSICYDDHFSGRYITSINSSLYTIRTTFDETKVNQGNGPILNILDSIDLTDIVFSNWRVNNLNGASDPSTLNHQDGITYGLMKMYRNSKIGKDAFHATIRELADDNETYINTFEKFFTTLKKHSLDKHWDLNNYFSKYEIDWMESRDKNEQK